MLVRKRVRRKMSPLKWIFNVKNPYTTNTTRWLITQCLSTDACQPWNFSRRPYLERATKSKILRQKSKIWWINHIAWTNSTRKSSVLYPVSVHSWRVESMEICLPDKSSWEHGNPWIWSSTLDLTWLWSKLNFVGIAKEEEIPPVKYGILQEICSQIRQTLATLRIEYTEMYYSRASTGKIKFASHSHNAWTISLISPFLSRQE